LFQKSREFPVFIPQTLRVRGIHICSENPHFDPSARNIRRGMDLPACAAASAHCASPPRAKARCAACQKRGKGVVAKKSNEAASSGARQRACACACACVVVVMSLICMHIPVGNRRTPRSLDSSTCITCGSGTPAIICRHRLDHEASRVLLAASSPFSIFFSSSSSSSSSSSCVVVMRWC